MSDLSVEAVTEWAEAALRGEHGDDVENAMRGYVFSCYGRLCRKLDSDQLAEATEYHRRGGQLLTALRDWMEEGDDEDAV